MLETPHVVVGAAIAFKVANPVLAIPLALGSHFVLEKVPHWNPHLNTEKTKYGKITPQTTRIVFADAFLAAFCAISIASLALPDLKRALIILVASFAAALPDLIEAPYFFLNKGGKLIRRWVAFQKSIQVDASILPGLLTQVLTVLASFLWILK